MTDKEHLIVVCHTFDLSWDLDYDPPECDDPDHEHDLLVIRLPEEDTE